MNILYLENHAVFAEQVTRQFLREHRVTVVPSLAAARSALASGSFDLVLSDYDLDDGMLSFSAFGYTRSMQSSPAARRVK